jgi:molybdopterin converting factor small subunit
MSCTFSCAHASRASGSTLGNEMKVKIKGYLTYKASLGEQFLDLGDKDKLTLRELLVRLSQKHKLGDSLYRNNAGTVNDRTIILINGRHHLHLPDQLDTIIKDGDEVAIFPPLAGG